MVRLEHNPGEYSLMFGRLSGRLAVAGFATVLLLQPQSAFADYKKVGPDKRSAAQIAEDECSAQAQGSGKVIAARSSPASSA
jgi:hypothetical protein